MHKNVFLHICRKQIFLTTTILIAALAAIGCQSAKHSVASAPRHPLYGTWIRKSLVAENGQKIKGNSLYYKIIHNDQVLLVDITQTQPDTTNVTIQGRTMHFSYVCDTLIQENGVDTKIQIIDNNHFSLTWYQRMLIPDREAVKIKLTELWERQELPETLKDFLLTKIPSKR